MTATAPTAAAADDRIFTRDFVLVVVANLVNALGQQMAGVLLPLYVLELGGDKVQAGMIIGVMAFVALVLRPPVGWLVDAWARRPLVLIGAACYVACNALYTVAGSVPLILAGRALHGFGLCNYSTGASTYLADIAPPRRRAEAMGLYAVAFDLGLIIGPALGFALLAFVPMRGLFALAGVLSTAALLMSFLPKERRVKPPGPRPAWNPRTGIVAMAALPAAWTAFCIGLAFGPLSSFIAIYAQEQGIANPGLYFTTQAVALMLSRTFSGRLADRFGRGAAIIPGLVMMALALMLLPFAADLPHFLLSAALFGMGFGAAQPSVMALVVDLVDPNQRGMAVSTYFVGFDLGISAGAIGLGAVGQSMGYGVLWPVCAACTLAGLLGLLFAKGAMRRPEHHH